MDAAVIPLRALAPGELDRAIAIDDDACALYASAGLVFDLAPDHPFAQHEHARWRAAAEAGLALVSGDDALLVLSRVAGQPHLEQLSVRTAAMRRGLGRALVRHAIAWAADEPLWLTTYAHLPWNRPFYASEGFEVVADPPDEIRAILDEQRRWLPAPDERVAMRLSRASRAP